MTDQPSLSPEFEIARQRMTDLAIATGNEPLADAVASGDYATIHHIREALAETPREFQDVCAKFYKEELAFAVEDDEACERALAAIEALIDRTQPSVLTEIFREGVAWGRHILRADEGALTYDAGSLASLTMLSRANPEYADLIRDTMMYLADAVGDDFLAEIVDRGMEAGADAAEGVKKIQHAAREDG